MNEIINTFKSFGFSEEQAFKLASVFTDELTLNKNDYFLKEGSVSNHVGYILNGMCRYFYVSDIGEEVTRWVSLENEFVFSFGSFIKRFNTNENIQAIVPVKMLVAHKDLFDALYKKEEFARQFWTKSIEEYLIGIEARVYSLIALNAQNRYNNLIKNYPKLVREVPDKYIASILGIKPRHLSRLRAATK